jgi:hypothetical protein
MFRFKCTSCEKWHEGMPGFEADAPLYYYYVPKAERAARCKLTANTCTVDDEAFFVKGVIEIPVHDASESFTWGTWVSLSQRNFEAFVGLLDARHRSQFGPYFGWLSADFKVYPTSENLKTYVHLRDNGLRPSIELEPTDHLLAVEQREGITVDRVAEIYAAYVHS